MITPVWIIAVCEFFKMLFVAAFLIVVGSVSKEDDKKCREQPSKR